MQKLIIGSFLVFIKLKRLFDLFKNNSYKFCLLKDVTEFDFNFMLRQFQADNSIAVHKFQERLSNYLANSKLVFRDENPFWNLAYSLHEMEIIQPEFYSELKENSSLVMLKGDLNYRKLLSDLNWQFETPLSVACRGFKPASICAIRTLKSDLIADLNTNVVENKRFGLALQKFADNNKWMLNGDYGLIQFFKA